MDAIETGGGAHVGGDANSGRDVVGRDHIENNYYEPPPPPGKYPPEHPLRQYTLTDVVAALIGDPLTNRPGLVAQIAQVEAKLADMQTKQDELGENQTAAQIERHVLLEEVDGIRHVQDPYWYKILALSMAMTMIILLIVLILKVR